ncbi:hypothetical protein [Oceanobacillus halophilus]
MEWKQLIAQNVEKKWMLEVLQWNVIIVFLKEKTNFFALHVI